MRVRDKHIKRASVTVADRTKKNFKSRGITVYGVSPAELLSRLEEMNRQFFGAGAGGSGGRSEEDARTAVA